jgi:hypothetical protein
MAGSAPRGSGEAAAFRYVDLHQLSVMHGKLDHAVPQVAKRLGNDAKMLGQVMTGGIGPLAKLLDWGTHGASPAYRRRIATPLS